MDVETIELLRREHAAWRLLRADHAPLVLAVLGEVFVEQNVRAMPATDLTATLQAELDRIAEQDPGRYPRRARDYLDDWARPDSGWLRKFYPPGSAEPSYDATPALETAYRWITGLRRRTFVGTASRLATVVDLLKQVAIGTQEDPDERVAQLERERAAIDAQIAAIRGGEVPVLDRTAQLERYEQARETALELLSDFRQVEANFRALDLDLRERVALWDGGKGALLDGVVGARSGIADSDQGRTFNSFWDFLLSAPRREELVALLNRVAELGLDDGDGRHLVGIQYQWLEAAEQTQATVRVLSEQLRRFIDDRVWLENRRVGEILHAIEGHAWRLREDPPTGVVAELDEPQPSVVLPMERPLYRAADAMAFETEPVELARADLDTTALFAHVDIDSAALAQGVRAALRRQDQVPLAQVVAARPIEHGLGEVVAYLGLHDEGFDIVTHDGHRDELAWESDDVRRVANVPAVTYVRRSGGRPDHQEP